MRDWRRCAPSTFLPYLALWPALTTAASFLPLELIGGGPSYVGWEKFWGSMLDFGLYVLFVASLGLVCSRFAGLRAARAMTYGVIMAPWVLAYLGLVSERVGFLSIFGLFDGYTLSLARFWWEGATEIANSLRVVGPDLVPWFGDLLLFCLSALLLGVAFLVRRAKAV